MFIPFIKLIEYIDVYMLVTLVYVNLNLIAILFLHSKINMIIDLQKKSIASFKEINDSYQKLIRNR
jgi:hypothetical protein